MPEYPQSWPMPKSPMPIVIFGAGSIVSDAHLPAYKFSNLPVKGIYDPDYEKAKKLAQFAKKQGYKNAFIVPFLGNSKITISEALRLLK